MKAYHHCLVGILVILAVISDLPCQEGDTATSATPQLPRRPTINLADYAVITLEKGEDWRESDTRKSRIEGLRLRVDSASASGYYTESLKGVEVRRRQVGTWKYHGTDDGIIHLTTYNRHGIPIGPAITYWDTPGAEGIPKKIYVLGGRSASDLCGGVPLSEVASTPGHIELLEFSREGDLQVWYRVVDGVDLSEYFGPDGSMTGRSKKWEGFHLAEHFYPSGLPKEYMFAPTGRIGIKDSDIGYLKMTWTSYGFLASLVSGAPIVQALPSPVRYKFPLLDGSIKESRQSIVWHDGGERPIRPKEAGRVKAQDSSVKIGDWLSWDIAGNAVAKGSYVEGRQEGQWEESESLPVEKSGNLPVVVATSVGIYAKGVRDGIWTTTFTSAHPESIAYEAREDAIAEEAAVAERANRAEGAVRRNPRLSPEISELKEVIVYKDGAEVERRRNF